jgi:hypothetical protein
MEKISGDFGAEELKVKWFSGFPTLNKGAKYLFGICDFLCFCEIWWFLVGECNWGKLNQPEQKAPPDFYPAAISWKMKNFSETIF